MVLTQEELDEQIVSIHGEPMPVANSDLPLTIRFLLLESILRPDEGRSSADKLKGFAMANKVNLPMGKLSLEPDEVKFISDRVDHADWSDYLYGKIHEVMGRAKIHELPKDKAKEIVGAVKNNPEQKVTIRGDRTAAYASIVRVLDICKSAGIQEPYLDTVMTD